MAAAVLAAFSGPTWAEDEELPPFVPSNESLDEDLDRSLDEEFSTREVIPDAPDAPSSDDDGDDEPSRIKLRLMGAFWRTQFKDVVFAHRDGGVFTDKPDRVKISDPLDSEISALNPTTGRRRSSDALDGDDDGFYELTLTLGKYVALRAGFAHNKFDYSHTIGAVGAPKAFTFGKTTWATGEVLDSEFEIYSGDLEIVLRPVNNPYITIDVTVGLRYAMFKSSFDHRTSALVKTPDAREKDKLEAGVPTIGIGLSFRPIKQLEFFARARIGALSYERDASLRYNSTTETWDRVGRMDRDAQIVDIDAGISLVLGDTIGVIAGYRFSSYEIERITEKDSLLYEGEVGGFYFGAILQF